MLPELCHFTTDLLPTPDGSLDITKLPPQSCDEPKKKQEKEQNPANPALTDSSGELGLGSSFWRGEPPVVSKMFTLNSSFQKTHTMQGVPSCSQGWQGGGSRAELPHSADATGEEGK